MNNAVAVLSIGRIGSCRDAANFQVKTSVFSQKRYLMRYILCSEIRFVLNQTNDVD